LREKRKRKGISLLHHFLFSTEIVIGNERSDDAVVLQRKSNNSLAHLKTLSNPTMSPTGGREGESTYFTTTMTATMTKAKNKNTLHSLKKKES
jgi:hypothetical protein